jgi:hypothetical protein
MTVRYLIDTDWAIDHLHQIDRVMRRLQELQTMAPAQREPHFPSAVFACGSQNVISIPRYMSMAVESSTRACSLCPV